MSIIMFFFLSQTFLFFSYAIQTKVYITRVFALAWTWVQELRFLSYATESSCTTFLKTIGSGDERDQENYDFPLPFYTHVISNSIIGKSLSFSHNYFFFGTLERFLVVILADLFLFVIDLVVSLCCRLGFVVDFLSHAAIVGFMGGAATVVCLQQLKGMLGLVRFTHATDLVSVMRSVVTQVHEVLELFLFPNINNNH